MHQRWTAHRARRREQAAARRGERSDGEAKWYDFIPLPFDFEIVGIVLVLIALLLAAVFVVPYVWLGVLFGVELVVWLVLTALGYGAWLLFRRPWTVAIVDSEGNDIESVAVRGRRRAKLTAQTIREHLAAGLAPDAAMRLRAAFNAPQ